MLDTTEDGLNVLEEEGADALDFYTQELAKMQCTLEVRRREGGGVSYR